MKKRLNTSAVAALPVKKAPYFVHDMNHPGLVVRVGRRGKSVAMFKMVNGVRKFQTVGTVCNETPFELLRKRALEKADELESLKSPDGHCNSVDPTLAATLERYLKMRELPGDDSPLKPRTVRSYKEDLKRTFGDFYSHPISCFTPTRLLALHEDWKQRRHKPRSVWANGMRTLRLLVKWSGGVWPKELRKIGKTNERPLPLCLRTPEGRRQLIADLLKLGTPAARGCVFVALTGLRRGDATRVTRDDLADDDILVFPYKSRDDNHVLPLSHQAASLINRDGKLLGVSETILRKPLIKLRGTIKQKREDGKIINASVVCPQDLRRMLKTAGRRLKIDPVIIELLAGHELQGVLKHYDQNQDLDLLRDAAQRISDELWPMSKMQLASAGSLR